MKTSKKEVIIKTIGAIILITCAILAIANDVGAQTPQDSIKTCKGVKSDKTGCKSTFIVKDTDYCQAHNPNAVKCSGTNSANKPCGMTVKQQGNFCRYHQPVTKP